MQKIKSINWGKSFGLIKCCLIGVVATLIGTLIFAFVLKFTNLSSSFINYVNNFIKAVSLYIALTCAKKKEGKLIFKALVIGIIYSLLTFFVFAILNGGADIGLSLMYDLIFAVVTSVVLAIIINLLSRKAN